MLSVQISFMVLGSRGSSRCRAPHGKFRDKHLVFV